MCQIWTHYECIDEKENGIIGLKLCNVCRSMSSTVAALSLKVHSMTSYMKDYTEKTGASLCLLARENATLADLAGQRTA